MTKELKEYFDSIPDDYFIYYICSQYLTTIPIWERCSEKEYEKNHPKNFEEFLQTMMGGTDYRKVPVYHRGGGILDQIQLFNVKPDGYYYEKCVGYKKVLMLGSEMIEYCQTRKCVKDIIQNLEVKEVDLEKEVDIEDAVHGTVDYPLIGCDFPNIYPNYKELKDYCDRKGIKDNDKVKLIIIKDM